MINQVEDVEVDNLRLAIVAPGEFFGGAERQILNLSRYLKERSIDFDLLLFYDRELAAFARKLGLQPRIVGVGKSFDLSGLAQLSSLLRKQRYCVVHTHGYKATVMAGIARVCSSFRLVKTEHGRAEVGIGSRKERFIANVYRSAENALSRWARATVVYVTQDLHDFYVREHRGIASCVIRNGIDTMSTAQLPRPEELNRSDFNVVVLGRLEHIKGVEHAIHAMSRLRSTRIKLHIVGEGPMRASLTQLAVESGVERAVIFHGFREDGVSFAAHAHVLLMPSLHEGLPYTLLEAISAGTAVCASRVGGLAEVLEHERTALLFEPCNPDQIAQCLIRMNDDADLRQSCADRAKQLLLPLLTSEVMGEKYLTLFRRLQEQGTSE